MRCAGSLGRFPVACTGQNGRMAGVACNRTIASFQRPEASVTLGYGYDARSIGLMALWLRLEVFGVGQRHRLRLASASLPKLTACMFRICCLSEDSLSRQNHFLKASQAPNLRGRFDFWPCEYAKRQA